eukprot:144430_1
MSKILRHSLFCVTKITNHNSISMMNSVNRYFANWPDASNDFVPDDILRFWFGDITSSKTHIPEHITKKWFMGGKEFDQEIISMFGGFMHIILNEKNELHKIWLSSLKGTVAYIIIADQFARNVYRGTPKAFENDIYAQNIVNKCIETGNDKQIFQIHPAFNSFLYMPLMHSENINHHYTLEKCQNWMLNTLEKEHPFYSFIEMQVKYGKHHREIIELFDRFPQRNEILGRQSTDQEIQYIKDHDLMRLINRPDSET